MVFFLGQSKKHVKVPDLCGLLEFHCQESHLSLDTDVSPHSSRCERAQGQADSLLAFKRKYRFSLNCGDVTDVDWLASQHPLLLHSHLCTRSSALS